MRTGSIWRRVVALVGFLSGVAFVAPARANSIVEYTFDGPSFSAGELTPILNAAPDVNPGTFLTSFTDSTFAAGYAITTFLPNGLFSGQDLAGRAGRKESLTLTFNTPVDQIIFDFGLDILNGSPAGSLAFVGGGVVTQLSSDQPGGSGFQGGLFSFSSNIPFTTVTLSAFDAAGAPVELAIDNLQLETTGTTVPEPATLTLTSLALAGLIRQRRRR